MYHPQQQCHIPVAILMSEKILQGCRSQAGDPRHRQPKAAPCNSPEADAGEGVASHETLKATLTGMKLSAKAAAALLALKEEWPDWTVLGWLTDW